MDLVKTIDSRRSIRAFKPDPVSRDIIDKILSLVIKAPSAINLQPWEFIVVMEEEKDTAKSEAYQILQRKTDIMQSRERQTLGRHIQQKGACLRRTHDPLSCQDGAGV